MRIFCLLGNGRAGIDFFQTLFDKHPEVSQMPGIFFFDEFWEKTKNFNKKKIAEKFIDDYRRFFNSKNYVIERHNELGKKKNEYFIVSKKIFKEKFIKFCKKPQNQADVFLNLHLAYSAASGENIRKKKCIILNIHNFENLFKIRSLDFEIFLTLRNPISSLNSSTVHWLNYSRKNVNLWWLNYQINRLANLINNCKNLDKKIHVARLDLIHTKNVKIMKKVSKIMKIKYHSSMKKSTYHGKLWWGDKLSNKNLSGVNKNFEDRYDPKNFFDKDIRYLENSLHFYYTNYKFKRILKKNKLRSIYKFLPLKLELIVWKNLLLNFDFLQIILIPYYMFKRIKILKIKLKKTYYPKLIYND
tara:strand:- start:388 stop:1461 length:1074 start_codon:yes stop_codon:yes gene_type:complete